MTPTTPHSPPYSAKVKIAWSCTCIRLISLHGVDRDDFTFCYIDAVSSSGVYVAFNDVIKNG